MVVARLLMALALLVLVGCTTPSLRGPEPRDGPPAHAPVDLARLPDPVVRDEPKSARGNPRSYTVRGKTYRVMDTATGYRASGLASWYGSKFHGRQTSSGEPFDMFALTAAHRSLPLPTFVRVTNLQNGRTTIVRVNDRGPFHADRLIDLSYAGAVKLGFTKNGTARVRLEVVEEAIEVVVEEEVLEFFLQAGAFRDLTAADSLKAALSTLTGAPAYVVRVSEDALFRVRLGPVASRPEALRLQALITAADYGRPLILEY
jgi:rare lipoprotein A